MLYFLLFKLNKNYDVKPINQPKNHIWKKTVNIQNSKSELNNTRNKENKKKY